MNDYERLEAHLRQVIDLRFDMVERVFNERMSSADRALTLSAAEYHRRLDALNGEADKLVKMQATYVQTWMFESRTNNLSKDVTSLQDFRSRMLGRITVYAVIVPSIVGGIAALLTILFTR